MPKELDAIARMREVELLRAALPAVLNEIATMIRTVDNRIVGFVRTRHLSSDDAIAFCHQKAALIQLRDRLLTITATKETNNGPKDPQG